MTHRRARSWMALAAGGDLAPSKAQRLERHLASCRICREEYKAYRESLDLARSEARRGRTPDWKEAEWRRVMKAARTQEPSSRPSERPRALGWAWAAAATVLIALVAGGYYVLRKTPRPPVIARLSPSGDVVLPEQTPPPPEIRLQAGTPRAGTGAEHLLAQKPAPPAHDSAGSFAAQPVMAMTFVSQETGLTIHWVFNDNFDYKEDKK